jgi:hypothetical protein
MNWKASTRRLFEGVQLWGLGTVADFGCLGYSDPLGVPGVVETAGLGSSGCGSTL